MPLEPIDEKDLDLQNKFAERKIEKNISSVQEPSQKESVAVPENLPERKEGMMEKESAYTKIISQTGSASQPQIDEKDIHKDAGQIGQIMDVESRVTNLVDVAVQKGVVHAVKVAKHLDDNYVLDQFHDKLMTEELHAALVEKGMIKNI